jgi:hypothetical protein
MEGREGINPAVTVIAPEAPSAYHVAPRNEVPNQVHNPEVATAAAAGGSTAAPAAPAADTVGVSPVSVGLDGRRKGVDQGNMGQMGLSTCHCHHCLFHLQLRLLLKTSHP